MTAGGSDGGNCEGEIELLYAWCSMASQYDVLQLFGMTDKTTSISLFSELESLVNGDASRRPSARVAFVLSVLSYLVTRPRLTMPGGDR